MELTKYFEGIRGEYIEFQITPRIAPQDRDVWLRQLNHWKKDSLFLRHNRDIPYKIFDKSLGDGWWLDVNQIDYKSTTKLKESLKDIQDAQLLVDWIESHSEEGTYLNVLGV